MSEIRFYGIRGPFGWISNFSSHPIEIDGKTWPTVEHYFQAMKTGDVQRQEVIRRTDTPGQAKRLGRGSDLIRDWDTARNGIMGRAVAAKFAQHPDLASQLLSTGDAELIENAKRDYYWGCGADGSGKNMLGVILMEVRAAIQTGANATT